MKVKPVIYYKAPLYPSGDQLQNHPKLLDKVPVRWAKNGLVLTALGMTMALCACAAGAPQGSGTMGESGEGNTPGGGAEAGKTMTAPVFFHGDGIGSYGCVSVTSPYFLSEEEAFEIIQSEARDYGGISFTTDSGMTLPDMNIPETVINGEQPKKETTRKGDLDLDGGDRDKNIGFEFVSKTDVSSWEMEDVKSYSTVSTYATKDASQRLQKELEAYGPDMQVGVFYDPCCYIDAEGMLQEKNDQMAKDEEEAMQISGENLRAQVRDFIDWLKGQGVI